MKLRQCQWGVAMAMLGACSAMSLGDGQIPDRATLDSILGTNQTSRTSRRSSLPMAVR